MKALLPPLPQPENQPDFAAGQDGPAEAHPPATSASAIATRNLSTALPDNPVALGADREVRLRP